MYEVTIGH